MYSADDSSDSELTVQEAQSFTKDFSIPEGEDDALLLTSRLSQLSSYSLSFFGTLTLGPGMIKPIPLLSILFQLIVKELTHDILIHRNLISNLLAAISLSISAFFDGTTSSQRSLFAKFGFSLPINVRYIDLEESYPTSTGSFCVSKGHVGTISDVEIKRRRIPYQWSFQLETQPYSEELRNVAASRGYVFLNNETPILDDQVWEYFKTRSEQFNLKEELVLLKGDLRFEMGRSESDVAKNLCEALKIKPRGGKRAWRPSIDYINSTLPQGSGEKLIAEGVRPNLTRPQQSTPSSSEQPAPDKRSIVARLRDLVKTKRPALRDTATDTDLEPSSS